MMKETENHNHSGHSPSPEKKRHAWLIWALRLPLFALLVLVLLAGFVMVVIQISPVQNRIRIAAEKTVSRQLGATVHIEHIEGSILSGIALEGVSIASPDGTPILSFERLSADYFLPMILLKVIQLREITLTGLQLDLVASPTGEWRLPFFSGSKPDAAPKKETVFPFQIHVGGLHIMGARINAPRQDSDAAVSAFLDIFSLSAAVDIDQTIAVSILDSDIALHHPALFPLALSGSLSFEPETSTAELSHLAVGSGASRILLDGDCRFDTGTPVFAVSIDIENLDLREISNIFSLTGLPESTASGTLAFSGTPDKFRNDISLNLGEAVFRISGTSGFDETRGGWTDFSARIEDLDIFRQGLSFSEALSGAISADISFSGNHLLSPSQLNSAMSASLKGLSIAGMSFETLDLAAETSGRIFSIRHLEAFSGQNRLDFAGTIDLESLSCNLDITADLPHPSALTKPHLAGASQQIFSLDGETHLTASLTGWVDRPSLRFSVDTKGISIKQHHADVLVASGVWEGLPGPDSRLEDVDLYIQGLTGEFLQSGTLSLKGDWRGWIDAPVFSFSLDAGNAALLSHHADRLILDGIWNGRPGPENRIDDLAISIQGLGGNLLEADSLSLKGSWHGWFDDPDAILVSEIAGLTADRLKAEDVTLSGSLRGNPNDEDALARVSLGAGGVRYDQLEAGTLTISANTHGSFSDFSGEASIEASQAFLYGQRFSGISLAGHVMSDEAVFRVLGDHENGSRLEIGGNVASWKSAPYDLTLDTLSVTATDPWPSATLSCRSPLRFSLSKDRLHIESCLLQLNDALLSLAGELDADGALGLDLSIADLELGRIPGGWNDKARLAGTASLVSAIGGSLARPVITSRLEVEDLTGYGISHTTDFSATIDYADTSVSFRADLEKQAVRILSAAGEIPLRLSLKPFSFATVPEGISASLSTQDLRFSNLPIPPVKGVDWDAVASMNLQISGTLNSPDLSGNLSIRDGTITLVKNKLTYESVTADISMANDRIVIDRMEITGDREGLLDVGGTVYIKKGMPVVANLTLKGKNFYIPFQKSISARISPDLNLSGSIGSPRLSGEVTISESKINLDQLSRSPRSDIQVVETADSGNGSAMLVSSRSQSSDFLSSLSADISVHVPRNAWLKGQDVTAEIAGDVRIRKEPGESFVLTGPLTILRGNYYFMGKNFQLTEGNVEFLGLKEINPKLNIETETRIKSVTIIATIHGTAQEMMVDLSSDPTMDNSDIISYLVFGRGSSDLSGNQAFSVEKSALSYTGNLLAAELRTLLGEASFIDTFSIDSGSDDRRFGAVTLGKYITPEIFISYRQSLSENDSSYQEITYALTPQIKLETQIGLDQTSSAVLTWDFDF